MDPQSQSFTPYSSSTDSWRLRDDVTRMQHVQTDHGERLARLERKQDDDARVKSVWGNTSPFPSVLSGTPQQAPLHHPPSDHFRTFDDEASNLMSSLHLDAEEEPRRSMATASRANSVRFDETANQNHFSHSTRPSLDLLSRSSSGLGAIPMTERTASHKSDGRASSAHSIRSLASGRANSLNMESSFRLSDPDRSPLDTPGFAPGLMLLGPVPAIVRCWMNTNFRHDALLYAAVCSGSHKSYLHLSLIQKLGFEEVIRGSDEGVRTVKLPIFFPEATTHPASSRSSSPAPLLPSLLVEFCVVERSDQGESGNAIQIFIGSDVLCAHNADILFSSNMITLYDSERHKLSIPLNRPESESAFNRLFVTNGPRTSAVMDEKARDTAKDRAYVNGLDREGSTASASSFATSPPSAPYRPPAALAAGPESDAIRSDAAVAEREARPESRLSVASRPSLSQLNTHSAALDPGTDHTSQAASLRPGSSPAIWNNWRRDGAGPAAASSPSGGLDWAAASKTREATYQRKETGIKVLKPKTASRAVSSSLSGSGAASPADGKSRFFDEGRQRSGAEHASPKPLPLDGKKDGNPLSPPSAPRAKANPIGGASAFSWLNAGGGK